MTSHKGFTPTLIEQCASRKRGKVSVRLVWGFTIVEMVIVLGIIVLTSGVILVNQRAGEQQLLLDRAAHKIALDIRRTMEFSLRAQEFAGCGDLYGTKVQSYGTNLRNTNTVFTQSQGQITGANHQIYILYVNCDGGSSARYECSSSSCYDADLEILRVEKGVRFQTICCNNAGNPINQTNIAFLPPDPLIEIRAGNNQLRSEVDIVLELESDSSKTKTIHVDNKGVVTIQ